MDWLVPLIVVLVVVFAVGAALKARFREPEGFPYTNNRVLFSPAERSFLAVLDQAVGREYIHRAGRDPDAERSRT
jgi:hypothetical protein